MGWIGCLRCEKFRRDFVARTFALVRPVLQPSFVRQPNGPKCTQKVQNAKKHQFRSNGVDRVPSLRKIPTRLRGTNFCTSSARFAQSFVRQPNGPECTQILGNAKNVILGSDGVFQVRLLRKIPTRLRGTNFCTSLAILHRVS